MSQTSHAGGNIVAHDKMKRFLEEHPELAEALQVFQVSSESYARAMEAINPVLNYTSTSTQDSGPKPKR